MKTYIGIFVLILGILGGVYSFMEYQNLQEIKGTLEYKTGETTDNLAYNYLGIERENYLARDIKGKEQKVIIIAAGSLIFLLFGLVLIYKGSSARNISS